MKFKGVILEESSTYPVDADNPTIRDRVRTQLALRIVDKLLNSGLLEFNIDTTSILQEVECKLTLDLEKYVNNSIKQIIDDATTGAKIIKHPMSYNNYNTSSSFFASYPTGSFDYNGRSKSVWDRIKTKEL